MNAAWRDLADELARWRDAGKVARFWWRDDDAASPGPAVSRLVRLSQQTSVPLALAVIPLRAERDLFEGLDANVAVLQHGTDHRNRASAGEKKTEFPAAESPDAVVKRLAAARERLALLAGARFVPALAPPWNRLPRSLAPRIAEAGFRGLSQYGARAAPQSAPELAQVNTHVDVIAWQSGRGFAGEAQVLAAAVRHLSDKREGRADAAEPTGWLTHHAVHDESAWQFLEQLFETLRPGPALEWCTAQELFNAS